MTLPLRSIRSSRALFRDGAGVGLIAVLAASAAGQPTNFGNFVGDTVEYRDVLENTDGFFSAPVVSGDTLDFTNGISLSSFEAESLGGNADSVTGSVNAFVVARPGRALDFYDVEATVQGGLQEFVAGTINADTSARLVLSVVTRIVDVDGTELADGPLILQPIEMDLLTASGADGQGGFTLGSVLPISVAAAAEEQFAITGDITRILWSISLTLEAESQASTRSTISLRAFDSLTVTFAVPEPSMLLLTAPAAGMLVRRRRRQH